MHLFQRKIRLRLPRLYRIALAFTAALVLPTQTPAQVYGPRLVSSRTPDLYDLESYVKSVVKPGMTQKQRAIALWSANYRQMYHWNNPVEYPLIKPGELLDVTDPIRLMNVYGYTLCFCSAAGMESVWREAGLEGREFALPGHVSNEVWFDGAYHYLDMEFKGYLTRPDGEIASARDCGLRPAEIAMSSSIPPDFFPLTRYPFRSYLSKMVFAGLLDGGPTWYASHRAQSGHVMHVGLRPGECYYRSWDNVGKFVNDYRRWIEPGEFGTFDCRYGPHELDGPRSFGNGVMIYEPDLTSATDEFERGVFLSSGLTKNSRGLCVAKDNPEGQCIFRVQLPYVICGRPSRLDDPGSATGAALVSLEGTGQIETHVSVDNGKSWLPAASAPGKIDLSRFVERRYGYQIRLRLRSGAEVTGLRFDTYFQLAQAALPALERGTNAMTFDLGEAGELIEWTVPTWESEQAFTSSAWKLDNVRWTGDWTVAVQPADRSREGSAIFEIKAPPGKVLTGVSADVGGSMNNTGEQVAEDRIDVLGSAHTPTGFRSLGSVQAPPYGEHWTRRLAVKMSFDDTQPVRRAYLKIRMFSKVRAALSDLRIRYFLKDERPRSAQADQLVITHGWIEDGRPRNFEKRGPKHGERYVVTTGGKFDRPAYVCMELPGRKSGMRAGKDPLGLNSYRPRPADTFPAEAGGYLANVPLLRQLDAEGLDGADTMVAILLEGANKSLSSEVRKVLGYHPDERLRIYMTRLAAAEPGDDVIRRGLAILDERQAPGRDAFLRQYIPTLKGDSFGIQYVRRIGWTGSHGDTDALRDCFDRTPDAGLKLAIAEASMRLGDKALAHKAAALAPGAGADAQIPVDLLLLSIPDLAAAARGRLAGHMADPRDNIRWAVVRDMNRMSVPPKTAESMELLKLALLDKSSQIRLEAIGALGRRGDGRELMRRALKIETAPSVRDAMVEALSGQSP
jgi:hypothetical protein